MINPLEELDVVDENDKVIKSLPRQEVHEQMLLHRTSLIWVVGDNGRVLCQQRSIQKDRWGGMWECWFGGHVLTGKTYLDTAIIETGEELGIKVTDTDLKLFGTRRVSTSQENIFASIHAFQKKLEISSIKYEKEEVEQLKWFTISELRAIYKSTDATWVRYSYELEMLDWLEAKF